MDDAELLLQWLYAHPKYDRRKVDAAHQDFLMLRSRGDRVTFAELVVRKRILSKEECEKVVREERRALKEQTSIQDEKPAPKPTKPKTDTRKAEKPRTEKREREKPAAPADAKSTFKLAKETVVVAGVLFIAFAGAVVVATKIRYTPAPEKTDAPNGGRDDTGETEPVETVLEESRALAADGKIDDAIRRIDRAREKPGANLDVLLAEREKLEKAARVAKDAAAVLAEAEALARDGKVAEAIAKLEQFLQEHEGDDSPAVRAVADAARGQGKLGDIIVTSAGRKPASDSGSGGSSASGKRAPGDIDVTGGGKSGKSGSSGGADDGRGGIVVGTGKKGGEGTPDRPGRGPGADPDLTAVDQSGRGPKHTGSRPVSETSGEGALSVVLGEDDDEEEKKPPSDDDDKDEKIEPIPLVAPKEVEPVRKTYFDRRKALADERLSKALRYLEAARLRRDTAFEEEARRALGASKQRPLSLELPGDISLKRAIVDKYERSGFHLKGEEGEAGFAWDTSRQDIAIRVRALAVRGDSAEDHYRFGRWLASHRRLAEAKDAFKKAVALDSGYARRIPDLARLEAAKAAFAGEVQRSGDGTIKIIYGWQSQDELRDWLAKDATASVAKGRLTLAPVSAAPARLIGRQEVHFTGDLTVDVKLAASSEGAPSVGFIALTDKGPIGWELAYDGNRGLCLLVDLAHGKTVMGPWKASRGLRDMRIEVRGDDVIAVVGGATRARVPAHHVDALRPFVSAHGGAASFEALKVGGRVSRDWLRKTFAGADELLQELLSEDALGAAKEAWERPAEPVSAEDPDSTAAAGMDEKSLKLYVEAKDLLDKKLPDGRPDGGALIQALVNLSKAILRAPKAAAPYYQRARCSIRLGKLAPALHDLNRAVERAGGFYEALAERAFVLAKLERLDEAEKDVAKASAWGPANGRVRSIGAFVAFRRYELEKALEGYELSFALAPRGAEEPAFFIRSLTHVIQGPAWERTFAKEAEHYVVKTDLSQAACDRYAASLEAIRPVYAKMIDVPIPPGADQRRSRVLVFDSKLGYLAYSLGAEGAWLESALGYYSPSFRQLLLYEDVGDKSGEDTLDTLFHEGFHQWNDGVLVGLPTWADEGLAEYFATVRVEPDGTIRDLGRVQKGRLQNLRWWLREKKTFWPFDELMNETHEKFMAEHAAFKYAQCWSMAHFFMEGQGGKNRKMLRKYLLLLRAGQSPAKAYNRTFGRVDLDAMEKAWLDHVKAMPNVEDE